VAWKYVVVGASGNGKATFSKRLAAKLDVPYVQLDELTHLPGWQEASDQQFRRSVDEATSGDGWVVDGSYGNILGDSLYRRADLVVWLDQSIPLVMTRLIRRAIRDIRTQRDMFNGNRQTWRFAFFGWNALVPFALRIAVGRRRSWPPVFAEVGVPVARLRWPREVEEFLSRQ
jgi:adenylate kinase family enzyme